MIEGSRGHTTKERSLEATPGSGADDEDISAGPVDDFKEAGEWRAGGDLGPDGPPRTAKPRSGRVDLAAGLAHQRAVGFSQLPEDDRPHRSHQQPRAGGHDRFHDAHDGDLEAIVRKKGHEVHGLLSSWGAVDADNDSADLAHGPTDNQHGAARLLDDLARYAAHEQASEHAVPAPTDDDHVRAKPARLSKNGLDRVSLGRHHLDLRPATREQPPRPSRGALKSLPERSPDVLSTDPLKRGHHHTAHTTCARPRECACGRYRRLCRGRSIDGDQHTECRSLPREFSPHATSPI